MDSVPFVTECDRLIAEGSLDPAFLEPEVRCDFLVDSKRKRLWAVQLDLLAQFDRFCKRHGFRYGAIGGTILGALRHKGFIPWDDDIDLVMPREDYERLPEFMGEFSDPYFLQLPGRDPDYCISLAKLRNSRTAQVSKTLRHCRFNQGVLIDIIPLDLWNSRKGRESYARINELNMDNANFMRQGFPNPDEEMRRRIAAWSGRRPEENLAEIHRLATQFADDPEADVITTPVTTFYPYDRIQFPKSCFDYFVDVPFEHTTIPVPVGAETVMEFHFGNWRAFPPVEKRGAWHGNEVFDADRPYDEVLRVLNAKIEHVAPGALPPKTIEEFLQEVRFEYHPGAPERDFSERAQKLSMLADAFLAKDGDTILGAIFGYCNRLETHTAYISFIGRRKKACGGLGARLHECFERHAAENNMQYILLEVSKKNSHAQEFYTRLGYMFEEERETKLLLKKTIATNH